MLNRAVMLTVVFLALAFARVHTFTITEQTNASGVALAPGEYKVELSGLDAVLTDQSGRRIQVRLTVSEGERKFSHTSITTTTENGARKLQSIQVGGTRNTILFE